MWAFSSSSTHDGTAYIIGNDTAGLEANKTISIRRDATGPSGFSLTYLDDFTNTTSQTITKNIGSRTDALSGVNDTTIQLQEQNATLIATGYNEGVCGTYGSWETVDTSLSGTYSGSYSGSNGTNGFCYKYRILLKDNVENEADSTSGSVIKIDTSVPVQNTTLKNTLGTYTEGTWSQSDVNVTLGCIDYDSGCAGVYYCTDSVDSCTPSTFVAGTVPLTISTEGQTYVRYKVQDNVNQQSVIESLDIKVDKSLPTVTINDPSVDDQWLGSTTYAVNYTATDTSVDSCWYTIDSGATNTSMTCGIGLTLTGPWSETEITLTIYTNDTLSQKSSATRVFNVDVTDPVLSVESGTSVAGYNYNDWIFLNVSVVELNVKELSLELYNDTGTIVLKHNTSTSKNFTGLSEGGYYYNVTVVDEASNNDQIVSGVIDLDLYDPNITITGPPANDLWYSSDPDVESVVTDTNLVSCWYTLDSGAINTSMTCSESITGQTWDQGLNEITIYANDTSGRESNEYRNFSKDTIAPTGEISYEDGNYILTTQTVYFIVNQGGVNDIGLDTSTIDLQKRTTNLITPGNCNTGSWSVWEGVTKNGCSEVTGPSGYYECNDVESVSSGICYQYRVYAEDLIGNSASYEIDLSVLI
jgi:hypothetical protein